MNYSEKNPYDFTETEHSLIRKCCLPSLLTYPFYNPWLLVFISYGVRALFRARYVVKFDIHEFTEHLFVIALGAIHKRRRNIFGRFWYPPPPCWNFDSDLPNFYILISCNIRISDPPSPLKYYDVFYGWPHSTFVANVNKTNKSWVFWLFVDNSHTLPRSFANIFPINSNAVVPDTIMHGLQTPNESVLFKYPKYFGRLGRSAK